VSELQNGLPPRRSRGVQRKQNKVSFKRVIQGGLIFFGTLFFGLIGLELYKANNQLQSVVSSTPLSSEQAMAPVEQTQTSPASPQSSNVASPPKQADSTESNASVKPAQPVTTPVPQQAVQTQAIPVSQPVQSTQPVQTTPAVQQKPAEAVTPQPAVEQPKSIRHVVVKGDNLFKLSRKYYGNNSGVARIAKFNGLAADAGLTIGHVIIIPLGK
jgi:nucleoid-associated protein YgaU